MLNLIDLAGSERTAFSHVQGDRMKEANAINKSLTCLSDVITAIAKNDPHIPYRNSILTYLLQDYMTSESKILMIVAVSGLKQNLNETVTSLRFATKVNNCTISAKNQV